MLKDLRLWLIDEETGDETSWALASPGDLVKRSHKAARLSTRRLFGTRLQKSGQRRRPATRSTAYATAVLFLFSQTSIQSFLTLSNETGSFKLQILFQSVNMYISNSHLRLKFLYAGARELWKLLYAGAWEFPYVNLLYVR
jgi:hypothetical protein